MAIVVEAPIADVRAALEADPAAAPLVPALSFEGSQVQPPRRSLEHLPTLITVVTFLVTTVASNIGYDVAKKLVLDALISRFGSNRVKEGPALPGEELEQPTKDGDAP